MNTNIDKKPGFKIAGLAYTLNDRNESKAIRDKFLNEYKNKGIEDFGSFYGLMEFNALEQNYNYFLGFELADKEVIDDLDFNLREIPESYYLELDIEDENLGEAYDYTYQKFFPNKKYFHGLGPDVEFYQYDQKDEKIGNVCLYICLKLNPHIEGEDMI